MPAPLDDALAELDRLVDEHYADVEQPDEGQDNFRCEGCIGCRDCRFCEGCTRCVECTYCEGCEDCESCTQCRGCESCTRTTHTEHSADCVGCSYLVLCLDCEDCVHCFACVGLAGEEFCVLNEKLTKSAYFKRVAALREELAKRVAAGWRPSWSAQAEAAEPYARELGPVSNPPLPPPPRFPTPPPFDTDDSAQPGPRFVDPHDDESRPIDTDRLLWSDAIPRRTAGDDGPTQPLVVSPSPTLTRVARPKRPGAADETAPAAATLRAARRPPRRGQ